MVATVEVHVPREEVGEELTEALARHGLQAELVDDGERYALVVSFADPEHERLLGHVAGAIETWLSESSSPLVVQQANGGCVVRPPGD